MEDKVFSVKQQEKIKGFLAAAAELIKDATGFTPYRIGVEFGVEAGHFGLNCFRKEGDLDESD